MYKVTIEKDGKIIHVEDNMTAFMLTGDKGDSAPQVEERLSFYFQNKTSFLVTEIMTLYLKTNDEKIQIKCLELLNEIPA